MSALLGGLILVPLVDQAVKLCMARQLGSAAVPLGRLGKLQVRESRVWLARGPHSVNVGLLWTFWTIAAAALVLTCSSAWSVGLLLGGALSHAIEMSVRGSVRDYVCLRFWPAFNVADVAITAGAIGLGVELFFTVHSLWPIT